MSTLRNLKKFQHVQANRGSLEEKTKIFEENARVAKLSIDKGLLVQVLQEENRAHDDAVKELDEKLQEENRAHDDAVKELEEKIADLDSEIESSSNAESISTETPSEPAQEATEPLQEPPTEADEQVGEDPYHDVRTLLQDPEVAPEPPKKKRRSLFSSSH
jgi:hypothetical protein